MSEELTLIYEKTGGITRIEQYTKAKYNIIKSNKDNHLCWGCLNGSPAKCKKIHDIEKKKIDNYDFINDGFQVFDKNNALESFIVSGCKNYVLEEKRVLSDKEKQELIQKRKKLILAYFGANNMKEAAQIRENLIKAGNLISFDNKGKIKIKK